MSGIGPRELADLLDRHGAALELFASAWCDCPADAVQEAFVELARLAQSPDQLLGWLYKAVKHRALTAGRSARRRGRHEAAASQLRAAWFEEPAGSDLDAEEVTVELARLPDEEREVIVAHIWGGLTFEQIAAMAGGSSSSMHRRYQAGLKRLRTALSTRPSRNLSLENPS